MKNFPPYQHRNGFIPVEIEDFGDGGAFPEIHVVQYPLNMGKPGHKSNALVTVDADTSGRLRTDALVKMGSNKNKIIQTQMSDIKEKEGVDLSIPDEKEQLKTANRTRAALESLVNGKIASTKPTTLPGTIETAEPTYIRYTPNPNAPGYNPAVKQRVIKMVEAQVDPMEPPKHKHMKVPRGPPSPPVPVLHSPPRKLTVADQQAWKIPPCVSNWKNARGFIIPLDKRLAADGRGLQEVTINDKFAMLSETMYIAERKAAEDLKLRNQIKKKMAMKEKEEREETLREMANRARMERAGIHTSAADIAERRQYSDDNDNYHDGDDQASREDDNEDDQGEEFRPESEEEKIERQKRERLRMDRRKEREREVRLENMKGNMRKNKIDRDEGRDISEKMALGMLKGTGKLTGESLYDSRLFNQSAGMDAGFGEEDEYNAYSKPLFDRGASSSIYRPRNADGEAYGGGNAEDADAQIAKLSDTSRFKPDKGFQGAEGGNRGGPRDAPVQFEKDSNHRNVDKRETNHQSDAFGIDDIVKGGSNHSKRRRSDYDE